MKKIKDVDDRFLYETYKIWLKDKKINLVIQKLDDNYGLYFYILLKNAPRFKVRKIKDYFDIKSNDVYIHFHINDFIKFIDDFNIEYENVDFSFAQQIKYDIESNIEHINSLIAENNELEEKLKLYWELTGIPIEFQ